MCVHPFGDPECFEACGDRDCRADTKSVVASLMGSVGGDLGCIIRTAADRQTHRLTVCTHQLVTCNLLVLAAVTLCHLFVWKHCVFGSGARLFYRPRPPWPQHRRLQASDPMPVLKPLDPIPWASPSGAYAC